MKKKYSLDFSIVRDTDRLHAVEEILDKLDTDPSATELEQMASYILYGKDEEGKNSIQRNELFKRDLLENEKVNTTIVDKKFKIFLTYSKRFISLTLFFKDGHYDDSHILIAKDEDSKKWASSIIKIYQR